MLTEHLGVTKPNHKVGSKQSGQEKGRTRSRSYKRFSTCGVEHCRRARWLQKMVGPNQTGTACVRLRTLHFILSHGKKFSRKMKW